MTKARKLEILNKVLNMLKTEQSDLIKGELGLCYCVSSSLTYGESNRYHPYQSMLFLKIRKPKKEHCGWGWFPFDKAGNEQRIKLVRKAIKTIKAL